jgi:succinyl-diaminopimelate desuccinylase
VITSPTTADAHIEVAATDGVRLAQELIRFRSLNPPGEEAACIRFLADKLAEAGMSVETYEFAPGRPSIIARAAGLGDDPPLCFTGHIDVVPLGSEPWSVHPFEGSIIDGKLFGRGSSDMKSGVAAFVSATLQRLARHEPPRRGIALVITAGEETGCQGAFHLAEQGVLGEASLLIVAEPSANQPIIAHKGSLRIGVLVRGRTAHSSMPEVGDNAIDKAAEMISRLRDHTFDVEPHALLGSTTACVTTVSGGLNINSVPDAASFTVDFRTVPAHSHGDLIREVGTLFGPEAEIEVVTDFPGFSTSPEEPALDGLVNIVEQVLGSSPRFMGAPYFTDASALVPGFGGVPTVVLGPGEVEQCHRTDEFCFVDRIEQSEAIYAALIEKYCE